MDAAPTPQCLNVLGWRAFTPFEMRDYLQGVLRKLHDKEHVPSTKSFLIVRHRLSPVDMYSYLKARFGEPNGMQNRLRTDDSDNWVHWDFNLKAGNEDVYIAGTYRDIHFALSEELTDQEWLHLLDSIRVDYGRVGPAKAEVLRSFEKWLIFPNRFIAIAEVCSELHMAITRNVKGVPEKGFPLAPSDEAGARDNNRDRRKIGRRMGRLYRFGLELSLITPVLAEAFINMVIVILCKKEIRENSRHYDAFLRSNIDAKVFDLPYKCEGFERHLDIDSTIYKNFKRVMDKRNHAIHGNIDPVREQIEVVYFEGKRPLFKEPGDHIAKRFEAQLKQYEPSVVLGDYESVHAFFVELIEHLEPRSRDKVRQMIEDPYPGYDPKRKIVGALLPTTLITGNPVGIRFDDELHVA